MKKSRKKLKTISFYMCDFKMCFSFYCYLICFYKILYPSESAL